MRHIKAREWQGCDIAYDFSIPASLYDATSGGSLVASGAAIARAEDQSGNAAHMTQATAANRPLRIVAAQNGLDAARFDGSNDYLTAGDVADLLAAPLEMMWLGKRTNTASVIGYFGKTRAAAAAGRWVLLSESGNHEAIYAADSSGAPATATVTGTTTPVCLTANAARLSGTATLTLRKNGASSTGTVTDGNTSANTTDQVLMGVYPDVVGNPQLAGSFLNGDVYECAKWGAAMTSQSRLRAEQSRLRKWGIASA